MLGYTFPVEHSYNPKLDRMKTWSRELMLRVIKKLGPQHTLHEYQFLTPIENQTARFLQLRHPEVCYFNLEPRHQEFDVYEFLQSQFYSSESEQAQLRQQSSQSLE
mmetsp:Transcript_25194/g.33741  ORF Transcript_25194/g.33741 Transcript_25194/m.33741 type:complete len:106 (-) Transcript_25194:969-1286(-)